jgi:hypothetical protein
VRRFVLFLFASCSWGGQSAAPLFWHLLNLLLFSPAQLPVAPHLRVLASRGRVRGVAGGARRVRERGAQRGSVVAWVNEGDHLRVFSLRAGGNALAAFDLLARRWAASQRTRASASWWSNWAAAVR